MVQVVMEEKEGISEKEMGMIMIETMTNGKQAFLEYQVEEVEEVEAEVLVGEEVEVEAEVEVEVEVDKVMPDNLSRISN